MAQPAEQVDTGRFSSLPSRSQIARSTPDRAITARPLRPKWWVARYIACQIESTSRGRGRRPPPAAPCRGCGCRPCLRRRRRTHARPRRSPRRQAPAPSPYASRAAHRTSRDDPPGVGDARHQSSFVSRSGRVSVDLDALGRASRGWPLLLPLNGRVDDAPDAISISLRAWRTCSLPSGGRIQSGSNISESGHADSRDAPGRSTHHVPSDVPGLDPAQSWSCSAMSSFARGRLGQWRHGARHPV